MQMNHLGNNKFKYSFICFNNILKYHLLACKDWDMH